jgi:hypothetical protein
VTFKLTEAPHTHFLADTGNQTLAEILVVFRNSADVE